MTESPQAGVATPPTAGLETRVRLRRRLAGAVERVAAIERQHAALREIHAQLKAAEHTLMSLLMSARAERAELTARLRKMRERIELVRAGTQSLKLEQRSIEFSTAALVRQVRRLQAEAELGELDRSPEA